MAILKVKILNETVKNCEVKREIFKENLRFSKPLLFRMWPAGLQFQHHLDVWSGKTFSLFQTFKIRICMLTRSWAISVNIQVIEAYSLFIAINTLISNLSLDVIFYKALMFTEANCFINTVWIISLSICITGKLSLQYGQFNF